MSRIRNSLTYTSFKSLPAAVNKPTVLVLKSTFVKPSSQTGTSTLTCMKILNYH
jgi:hypothetical protein